MADGFTRIHCKRATEAADTGYAPRQPTAPKSHTSRSVGAAQGVSDFFTVMICGLYVAELAGLLEMPACGGEPQAPRLCTHGKTITTPSGVADYDKILWGIGGARPLTKCPPLTASSSRSEGVHR